MPPNNDNVQQIKSHLDVVDVLSEYMQLKPAGQNYKGLCPFHNEKTPSFMVNKERQMWHCFGCNIGGDIFAFIQKIEGVEFPEALEILASKAGVTLQRYEAVPGEHNQRLKIFKILDAAQKFYHQYLLSSEGTAVRQYLSTRQVTADSLKEFGLGYSPKDWDKLSNYLRNQGFALNDVVDAGLALKSERGPGIYDRFRDRLMFPITDVQGRVVGFGGRTLQAEAKEAKYINSPQGAVYNKSWIVYNLDRAKSYIREKGYAVLVEGYMDVLACWQVGIKNVVAISGTALTLEQIKLISRYTKEFRFALDGDFAGKKSKNRGLDLIGEVISVLNTERESDFGDLILKRVSIKNGKDPDESIKNNPSDFKKEIECALLWGEAKIEDLKLEFDFNDLTQRKQARDDFINFFSRNFRDDLEIQYYFKRFAEELDYDEKSLRKDFELKKEKIKLSTNSQRIKDIFIKKTNKIELSRSEVLFSRLMSLVLKQPAYLERLVNDLKDEIVPSGNLQELYNQLRLYYNSGQTGEINSLLEELSANSQLGQLIGTLQLQAERDFADMEAGELEAELASLLKQLNVLFLSAELKRLSVSIRQAEQSGDQSELEEVLARFAAISQELARVQQ